jgi:hypothetical protein
MAPKIIKKKESSEESSEESSSDFSEKSNTKNKNLEDSPKASKPPAKKTPVKKQLKKEKEKLTNELVVETPKESIKKRIRKKTCEIDSIEKLLLSTETILTNNTPETKKKQLPNKKEKNLNPPNLKNASNESDSEIFQNDNQEENGEFNKNSNQTHVSFGKVNITIKKKQSMSPEELQEYYDNKFKITDSEKTAKLLVQEDDEQAIYEPMKADSIGANLRFPETGANLRFSETGANLRFSETGANLLFSENIKKQ